MFKRRAQSLRNWDYTLTAPVAGLDAVSSLMRTPENRAVVLENWFPYPDRLETRPGQIEHATGFVENVDRLHVYAAVSGGESLWATTDDGVFECTAEGPIGAAAIALTDGKTIAASISTGAGNYMFLVNGIDTLKQFDGASWTSVLTFGTTATEVYNYVEIYRQRLFLVKKDSLEIEYLAANSISGAPTNYPLGAIFRQGGYIVALGTWTIDGGSGPDDQIAIITNKGEVAVFSGSDPATWAFRGTFFVGRPLGKTPVYKYGGDLLFLTEGGIYPLSSVLQSSIVERSQGVTNNIRPVFSTAAAAFSNNEGWQIISDPLVPYLMVNLPSTPLRKQAVMHSQTGAWCLFSGLNAFCFARMGDVVFFGTATTVNKIMGVSDNGTNIRATLLQANSTFKRPRQKQVKLAKPYFKSAGEFNYNLGIANDFRDQGQVSPIYPGGFGDTSLWGTGIWGTSLWSGITNTLHDWHSIPDEYAHWKAFYLQVISNNARVSYIGSDFLFTEGSNF